MYSVILNNGKIITINADDLVEWFEKEKMVRFLQDNNVVARINMDSVVGWAKTDNIMENVPRAGFILRRMKNDRNNGTA